MPPFLRRFFFAAHIVTLAGIDDVCRIVGVTWSIDHLDSLLRLHGLFSLALLLSCGCFGSGFSFCRRAASCLALRPCFLCLALCILLCRDLVSGWDADGL